MHNFVAEELLLKFHLYAEHDNDRAPVEHVVDGGGGEGAAELVAVGDLDRR